MFFVRNDYLKIGQERFSARYAKIDYPKEWYTVVATCYFIGRLPFAPGSLACLISYPIYISILENAAEIYEVTETLWMFACFLLLVGVYAVDYFQQQTKSYNHDSVVIDELVGMFFTLAISFTPSVNIAKHLQDLDYTNGLSLITVSYLIPFVVYRLFDIIKPFIIGIIEDYARSAFGVMLDNILAAVFAGYTISFTWELILRFAI